MTEENIDSIDKNTPQKEMITIEKESLDNLLFFTDQVRFNTTIFQGIQLILKKLVTLEEQLGKYEVEPNGSKE